MGAAPAPVKAGSKGVLGQGQRPDPRVTEKRVSGGRALTSLNSWIWACSNMEKTLEEPRWACLVAVALPRVPAFLLACNTLGGEGSSPGHPRAVGRVSFPSLAVTCPGRSPPHPAGRPPAPSPALTILALQQPGCGKGPVAPFMPQPYHLQRQIRKGREDRPKLGHPRLGWGRVGPQVDPSHIPDDLGAPDVSQPGVH